MHKSVDNVLYYVNKARNNNAIATLQKLCILALNTVYITSWYLLNLKLTESS